MSDLFCERCRKPYPAEPTWEERLGWFDLGGGLVVCANCMTAEEWDEAYRAAAQRIDEPPSEKLVVWLAGKLAEGDDPTAAGNVVAALVDILRRRGEESFQLTLAGIQLATGDVALRRILERAIRALEASERGPGVGQ